MQKAIATSGVVGTLTLGVEMAAGRLLAPYFGSSLFQWAALIGTALLAYMLGYAAAKRITAFGLGWPLALGGLYVLVLPGWIFMVLDHLIQWPMIPASLVAAGMTIGVPSFLWAAALPYLQNESRQNAAILSWSAAGNLIGAWGMAFVMIPGLGTRRSFLALGLGAVAIALLWIRGKGSRVAFVSVCAALSALSIQFTAKAWAIWSEPWRLLGPTENDGVTRKRLEVADSGYQLISVWDEEDRRALMLNGTLQFLWRKDEPLIHAGIDTAIIIFARLL